MSANKFEVFIFFQTDAKEAAPIGCLQRGQGNFELVTNSDYDSRVPLNAEGDAAIYVVSRISGEGNDRTPLKGDIRLTDSEVRDILALDKKSAEKSEDSIPMKAPA